MSKRSKKKSKPMAMSTLYSLIGQFMTGWNLLEYDIAKTIVELCKLDSAHGAIITANLNFQTKMHILTTLTDLLSRDKEKEWIEDAQLAISSIHSINAHWRVLVVHCVLSPVDSKTVKVLKVSAKRKLDYPEITKTKTEFLSVVGEMIDLGKKVRKIAADLSAVTTGALEKAIADTSVSLSAPIPPGLLGPQILGFPHSPNWNARPQTLLQNPPLPLWTAEEEARKKD